MIVQTLSLIVVLIIVLSDRTDYDNVVEKYPETIEGNQEYTNHSLMVCLQYILSIILFCFCIYLVKQEEKFANKEIPVMTEQKPQIWWWFSAQHLIPLLLTIGLCLTLPIKLVMPSYIVYVLSLSILLQSYLIICSVSSCNLFVTAFCLLLTGGYLLYY